jgi:glutaredoxin-related protein
MLNEAGPGPSDDELDEACGLALQLNYRLGFHEAVLLGLLTDGAIRQLLRALVDWPTVEKIIAAEKKTAGTPGP